MAIIRTENEILIVDVHKIQDLIDALEFKATHIKAHADPEIFAHAAQIIRAQAECMAAQVKWLEENPFFPGFDEYDDDEEENDPDERLHNGG